PLPTAEHSRSAHLLLEAPHPRVAPRTLTRVLSSRQPNVLNGPTSSCAALHYPPLPAPPAVSPVTSPCDPRTAPLIVVSAASSCPAPHLLQCRACKDEHCFNRFRWRHSFRRPSGPLPGKSMTIPCSLRRQSTNSAFITRLRESWVNCWRASASTL